jgi:predicted kinase
MSTVHLVFGSQGAGKTTYARSLAEGTQSTRFSIDDWMGELYGPDLVKPLNFPWIMARVQRCESLIWSTATDIVRCGGSVVLDLGFMKINDRSRFVAKAEAKAMSVQMHFVTAPHDVRRKRVLSRNATQGETFAFEVTAGMFDFMEAQFEKPTDAELAKSQTFSSE